MTSRRPCHACEKTKCKLFVIDIEGEIDGSWRVAFVCEECLSLFDDHWVSQETWNGMNPKTTLSLLPSINDDLRDDERWSVKSYHLSERKDKS